MTKHLYHEDGSLTDDGAMLIHTVREGCARIYEQLAGFPVNEIMVLLVETATSGDLRDIATANYNLSKTKVKTK